MTTTLGKSLKWKRTQKNCFTFVRIHSFSSSQFFFLCVPIFFCCLNTRLFCVIRKNSEYSIDLIVWILQKLLLITFTTITMFYIVSISAHFGVFQQVFPSTLWPVKTLTLDAIIRVDYSCSNFNLRLLFMDPQPKATANCQV